jgi:hypothetical protein
MSITVTKCQCGAITVDGDDFSNSMTEETFEKEFPDLGVPNGDPGYYQCNHCVNHYGIDLCNCGSGEPVGECNGEHKDCRNKLPSQMKGEMKPFMGWVR